jgi:hypothetical protein
MSYAQARSSKRFFFALWKMMSSCLLWYLWKEKNDRSFEDREKTLEELKAFFFRCSS